MLKRLVLVAILCPGCARSHTIEADIPRSGESVSAMIGVEGGTLELGNLLVEIPADAVSEPTEIRVTVTSEPAPSAFTSFSPVLRFEPDGLELDAPITVRIPFAGDTRLATVFWTTPGTDTFAALPTEVERSWAIATTTHFSRAFVGTACTGDDCCSRGNGELDVLLMVDNSNSMSEEQASLGAEIPRMVRALATGDIDADGVQDFPALHSLHIGVVTSDMGTGGYSVPTCDRSDFGDDGILRTAGNTSTLGCAMAYPSYAEIGEGGDTDAFVRDVSCVAVMGTGGCGFEQQLDAVLKSVTPSSSTLRFVFDSVGNADGENAGFLRSSSILATIVLTDENDCSASDPNLFDPEGGPYAGVDLNLRCSSFPEALHPASRYVGGLRALRANPADVIFALIAGVPPDLVSDASAIDYDAILADPRMEERVDTTMRNRLTPSCNVPGRGVAFPPTRMVQVARDLAPHSVVQSICQADLTPVMSAILQRVARRVSGACGG